MKDLTWDEVFAPFEPLLSLLSMDWTQEAIEDEEDRMIRLQDRND